MKLYKNKKWLYQKYWGEKLSLLKIANQVDVDHVTILNWMKKFNIKRRTLGKKARIQSYKDKDWLNQKYWEERLSTVQIAGLYGVHSATIVYWMKKFDLKCRTKSEVQNIEDRPYKYKHWLREKHWEEKLTFIEMAKLCRCALSTICYWMDKFKLKRRKVKIKKICKQCGKKFERNPRIIRAVIKENFCTQQCHAQYMDKKINIKCDNCGNEFKRSKSQIRGNHNFCNRQCFCQWLSKNIRGENHPNWQGGLSFESHGIEFNNLLRKDIRQRDDFSCQVCSVVENGKPHDVHHIDYDKRNNDPGNLITLCHSCHSKTNFNRQYWQNHFMFSMQLRRENLINGQMVG